MADITAIIYARVSDRKQSEQDVSVPTQIEIGQRKASELGARVLRVFVDDGKSAWKEQNRRQFEAAVDMATSMEATYFICWDSARFARNKYESMINKRLLDDAGVELVYISTPIDRNTDMGWAMDGVLEIFNELTSRRISADTRRSMMRNARLGYWVGGRAPFGYTSEPAPDNPKRRKLAQNPEEAPLVLEIFRLRGERLLGAFQIAAALNARKSLRRGMPWTKQTVLNLLRNQAAIGNMVFGHRSRYLKGDKDNMIVVPSHEGIVPLALWEAVQETMDEAADITKASGSPKSTHAFTGILRCKCGSSMQIETSRSGSGKIYFYYRCKRSMQNRECEPRRVRADLLDDWLSDYILQKILSRSAIEELVRLMEEEAGSWAVDHRVRRNQVLTRISKLQESNERLYSLLELHGKDAPNLGDLTQRLRGNNAKVRLAEAELEAIDAEQAPVSLDQGDVDDLVEFLHAQMKSADHAKRARAFYKNFISSVVLDGAELVINYSPSTLLSPKDVQSRQTWRPKLDSNQRPPD